MTLLRQRILENPQYSLRMSKETLKSWLTALASLTAKKQIVQ